MDERLDPDANAKRKGLSELVLMNMTTGKSRGAGVRFRMRASDKGLMLNCCPWCGADIRFWEKPKT